MKKMIILVGFLSAFSLQASTMVPVTDIAPVENMYAAFEIKTPNFEKVILDCQSFIHGVNFYNDQKLVHAIRIVDYGECEAVYDFMIQSKVEDKSICMEIEEGTNDLSLSNADSADCL